MSFLRRFRRRLLQPRRVNNAPPTNVVSRADLDYNHRFFESQLSAHTPSSEAGQGNEVPQMLLLPAGADNFTSSSAFAGASSLHTASKSDLAATGDSRLSATSKNVLAIPEDTDRPVILENPSNSVDEASLSTLLPTPVGLTPVREPISSPLNADQTLALDVQSTTNMMSPNPNPLSPVKGQVNQSQQIATTSNATDDGRQSSYALVPQQTEHLALSKNNKQLGVANVVNFSSSQPTTTHEISGALDTFMRQAEMYIKQKNWEKALSTCDRALVLAPNHAEAYKLKGNIFQYMEQPAEAMGCYAEALVINPQYPEVHANLGTLYGTVNDWEKAVACYEKAVEIDPGFVQAYRHLAKAWEKLNKPENRVNVICQALSLSPETFTLDEHLEMGYYLLDKGQDKDAIECFQQVLALDPNYTEVHQVLAQCLETQGDWEQAVHHYNKALSLVSNETIPNLQRASSSQLPSRQQPSLPGQNAASDQAIVIQTQSGKSLNIRRNVKNEALQLQSQNLASPLAQNSEVNINVSPQTSIQAQIQSVASDNDQEAVTASIESLISLARSYVQHQNFEKAIAHYKNALKFAPNDARIYRELTGILEKSGETNQAIESRYRMLRLQPDWGTAQEHYNLGNALLQKGDRPKAIDCYSRAVQLDPSLVQAAERLAQLATPTGASPVATAQANSGSMAALSPSIGQKKNSVVTQAEFSIAPSAPAVIMNPASEPPANTEQEAMELHKQGEAFFEQKRWEEAIATLRQAIALNPNFSWSHHTLGKALFEIEDWHGAAEAQKNAIALNSEFFWSHADLGDALNQLQQWNESAKAYQKALDIDPNCHQIICKLADTLKRSGQASLEQASSLYLQGSQSDDSEEVIYREALALNPQAVDVYIKLARVLAKQERWDEVIFTYQTARYFAPDNVEILSGLSKTLGQKEEWNDAVDCLHQALKIESDNAHLYFELGETYSCMGKLSEAVEAFQTSAGLNPNSRWTYQALGNVFTWRGNPEQAVEAYQKAISIDPNFAAAYKKMGDALTVLERGEDASYAYSKALEIDPSIL